MEEKASGNTLKKLLPGILVSVVIIGVLIAFVDWSVLKDALKNCSLKLFILLFALQTAAFFCRGMAWRTILEYLPSRTNAFFTIAEGYLLNLLPLRLGEIGRCVIMGGLIRKSPFYVFTTVVLERVFDLLVSVVFLICTVPLVGGAEISSGLYYGLFALILLGMGLMFWMANHKEKTVEILEKIFKPGTKLGEVVLPLARSVISGMDILTRPLEFLKWLGWILATWVFWAATVIFGMRAFFRGLPTWASFFVQGIGALGGAIPSAPAGIGVIEGAYVVSLGFFGIDQSTALAFGLVVHAIGIITPIIWGLIGFSVQGLKFTEVFENLKNTKITDEVSHAEE